jgi:hypothetical protein
MRVFVVGTREDVTGFAFAGIDGVVCATPDEASRAIARAGAETLVVLSAEFAREVPPDGPLSIVLPPAVCATERSAEDGGRALGNQRSRPSRPRL